MKPPALRVSSPKSNRPAPRAKAAPSQEEISTRAYQIWEQSGRPDGHDTEHWHEAEKQLRADAADSDRQGDETYG